MYLHDTSKTGSEEVHFTPDTRMGLHNLSTFTNMITEMSRCTMRLELQVFESGAPWTGTAHQPSPGFDFVMHSYPRTSLDAGYVGQASPQWIKLPVTAQHPTPRALVAVHEFLHVLTWWVQNQGLGGNLPHGAVHAPDSNPRLAQVRDEEFYAMYLQGAVEENGQLRGLTPEVVTKAGTPTSPHVPTPLDPQLQVHADRVKGVTPAGQEVQEVRWQVVAASSSPLRVEVRTRSGVVHTAPTPGSVGRSGTVQTPTPVTVCAYIPPGGQYTATHVCQTV